MEMEMIFSYVVLLIAVIGVCMSMESVFTAYFLQKNSFLRRAAGGLGQRFPFLSAGEDTFYCFFNRDALRRR